METLGGLLDSVIAKLSDENYAESFDFYRLWFDIGQTYYQIIAPDQVIDALWKGRTPTNPTPGELIHSIARLIVRFASDAESDHILAPHSSGLQSRLCTKSLQEFFSSNMTVAQEAGSRSSFTVSKNANLIAHWANLGHVEEATIRNHILQSLISHSKLYEHQAEALIILFKLAGATFETYAGPLVVDRCFKLLKDRYARDSVKGRLVKVRAMGTER